MARVDALLHRMDSHRVEILASISALPLDAHCWREHPTSWSALEVLEHLVLAEQVVLGELDTAALRVAQSPTRGERIRARVVWLVLRLGIRVRVPAAEMRPTGQRVFDELRREWESQHLAIRAFATGLDVQGVERRIFRHPVAGPLHMIDTLRLLVAHLRTHRRQLRRLQRAWQMHGPV